MLTLIFMQHQHLHSRHRYEFQAHYWDSPEAWLLLHYNVNNSNHWDNVDFDHSPNSTNLFYFTD